MTYERRASPLHAARAVVALAWCAALTGAALSFEHPVVLAGLGATTLAAAAGAGVVRRVLGLLKFAAPLALTVVLVNALVVRDGLTVLARLGDLPPFGQIDITLEATVYGLVLALRLIVVMLAAALVTTCVDPDEILRAFRRISFRSALTAALAVRLVPVLGRDARRMAEARRCRVDEPGRVAVLRAVSAGALDRATDVAATLELRGYRNARRGPGVPQPWSRHDLAFAASAVAVALLAVGAHVAGVAAITAYPAMDYGTGTAALGLVALFAAALLLPFADRRGIEP